MLLELTAEVSLMDGLPCASFTLAGAAAGIEHAHERLCLLKQQAFVALLNADAQLPLDLCHIVAQFLQLRRAPQLCCRGCCGCGGGGWAARLEREKLLQQPLVLVLSRLPPASRLRCPHYCHQSFLI